MISLAHSRYNKLIEQYNHVFAIPWPSGQCVVENKLIHTDDPNELVRPMLESEVGTQGIEWDWCIDPENDMSIAIGMNDLDEAVRIRLIWTK